MPAQVIEEVEKKFKVVGMKPTSENIQDSVVAQVSGTQYHIIGPGTATLLLEYRQISRIVQ